MLLLDTLTSRALYVMPSSWCSCAALRIERFFFLFMISCTCARGVRIDGQANIMACHQPWNKIRIDDLIPWQQVYCLDHSIRLFNFSDSLRDFLDDLFEDVIAEEAISILREYNRGHLIDHLEKMVYESIIMEILYETVS